MHSARVSIGKISLAVRYAALAPAEAKKKITAPSSGQRHGGDEAQEKPGDAEQHPGEDVGEGDHPDPPDPVEQRAQQQRAGEVAHREHRDVPPGLLDAEERGEGVAVGEEERVVEERLPDEQREAQDRAARIEREHGPRDHRQRDRLALPDGDRLGGVGQPLTSLVGDGLLDVGDDPLGLVLAAVDEQPARALRHVAADQQDPDGQDRAEAEGQPPAPLGVDDGRVQERDGQQRADGRADPERSVDADVDPAAVLRRDQLVDGGVDRGVLTADAEPGDEAGARSTTTASSRTP